MSMTPVINAFNSGEWSPLLDGRFDLAKYGSACRTLENFLIMPYGPVTRRPGGEYIAAAKHADKKCRIMSFEFSQTQAYHIEMGDKYMRFYKDRGQIVKASPAAWITSTAYVVGDFVTESATVYYCIVAHTSGTFATDLAAAKWVAQTAYEIPTDYLEADLFKIQSVQSADVMYLTHPSYPPQQLSRTGHDAWTLTPFVYKNGPFLDENITAVTVTPSYDAWVTATDYVIGDHVEVGGEGFVAITDHTSGAGFPTPPGNTTDWRQIYSFDGDDMTLTASGNTWTADHVGALWQVRHLRTDQALEQTFAAAIVESEPFAVFGGWRFITRAIWTGTIEIQRSFDNGLTWLTYQVYTSGNDFNTNTSGEEIETGVLFRIARTAAGSGTLSWMFNFDESYHVGAVKITGYTSATVVTVETQTNIGSLTATDLWSEGAWSDVQGYPACIAFFEERLMFAASTNQPQTVWGSKSSDYTNFSPGTLDDDGISYTIGADKVNVIRWMQPQSQLLIGTIGGEWRMGGTSIEEPLTPTNVTIKRQSTYGSKDIQGILVNDVVLFIQRQGRKVREMVVDPNSVQDKYVAPDLTILAEHITESGIVAAAYQQQPDSIFWCVRDDGELCAMTYERDQEVVGWHRHTTDGEYESISIIAGSGEDEIAYSVKRTIGGSDVRYIEMFESRDWGTDQADCFFVDSGVTYDGGDTIDFTGALKQVASATVEITSAAHGLSDGDQVRIEDVVGMTELNNNVYTVANKTANTFKLKDSAGTSYIDYRGKLIQLGCSYYWGFNQDAASRSFIDEYGGLVGSLGRNSDLLSQAGKINKSLLFAAASNDYVSLGQPTGLQVGTDPTTFTLWLKPNAGETGQFFIFEYSGGGVGWNITCDMTEVKFTNVRSTEEITATAAFVADEWAHVAIVRNGTNSRILVNNVDLTLTTNTDTLASAAPNAGINCYMMVDFSATYYDGSIDASGVFNRALTTTELTYIWNSGDGREDFDQFGDYVSGGTITPVENTFTGLSHLEGETVAVLADGGTHPDEVVASGAITLDFFANKVHVGLPYTSNLKPMKLAMGIQEGSSAARKKRIHEIVLRFFKTLNGKIGRDADNLKEIIFAKYSDPMGSAPELYTGDKWIIFNGDIGDDGDMYVRQDAPLPMTLSALMLKMEITE